MACILRCGHFVLVFDQATNPPAIKLDHEKINVHSRAIESPLPMTQTYFLISPSCALRCYLTDKLAFTRIRVL